MSFKVEHPSLIEGLMELFLVLYKVARRDSTDLPLGTE